MRYAGLLGDPPPCRASSPTVQGDAPNRPSLAGGGIPGNLHRPRPPTRRQDRSLKHFKQTLRQEIPQEIDDEVLVGFEHGDVHQSRSSAACSRSSIAAASETTTQAFGARRARLARRSNTRATITVAGYARRGMLDAMREKLVTVANSEMATDGSSRTDGPWRGSRLGVAARSRSRCALSGRTSFKGARAPRARAALAHRANGAPEYHRCVARRAIASNSVGFAPGHRARGPRYAPDDLRTP